MDILDQDLTTFAMPSDRSKFFFPASQGELGYI